jgi:hypothetical protein
MRGIVSTLLALCAAAAVGRAQQPAPAAPTAPTPPTVQERVEVVGVTPVPGRPNHLAAAVGIDAATTRCGSSAGLAMLTPSRGTINSGLLDADAALDLESRIVTTSALLSDTWWLTPRLAVTGSARVN